MQWKGLADLLARGEGTHVLGLQEQPESWLMAVLVWEKSCDICDFMSQTPVSASATGG